MKVIAHRGASAERPENTLAAFTRAVEIGVDGLEADLLLSKDGRLVVRHDDLIQVEGTWRYVRELTFAELRAIDVGQGERMPSLEEFYERFAGRCRLVLDIKTFGTAEPLAAFLRARRAGAGVRVTSFLHEEVAQVGRRVPDVDRSITLSAMPIHFEGLFRDTDTQAVALFRGYLNERITQRLRDMGISVWAYPVNFPREAEAFAAWGVEAIYTDDPASMQPLRRGAA